MSSSTPQCSPVLTMALTGASSRGPACAAGSIRSVTRRSRRAGPIHAQTREDGRVPPSSCRHRRRPPLHPLEKVFEYRPILVRRRRKTGPPSLQTPCRAAPGLGIAVAQRATKLEVTVYVNDLDIPLGKIGGDAQQV